MLEDRPYMRFRDDYSRHVREAINAVWMLIAINVVIYLLGLGKGGQLYLWANERYFAPYQLITYMFFHGGFTHLFFNMYGLFVFGRLVAPVLGRTKFLLLYFISGIGGALLHLLANWNSAVAAPTVGASGALFGVMMAVAMTRPNVEMYIMFIPVPVKMKTLVVVYAILEILSNGRLDNIAHLAHLGGFIGAYFFVLIFCKRDVVWSLTDIFKNIGSHGNSSFDRHAPQEKSREESGSAGANGSPEPHITHVSQKEVDRLLDKISREGVNSLTDYERAELQFFREQMQSGSR